MHGCLALQTCRKVQSLRIRRQDFAGLIDETASFEVCVWPVAEHYRLAGGWIYPEGDWTLTFPLKDSDLFLSFARLGVRANPSDEGIRHWVSKHGLLLREGHQRPDGAMPYELGSDGRVVANQAPMKLERLKAEIGRARDLLELYAELQARDLEAIEARAANPTTEIDTRLSNHPEWSGLRGAALKAYEDLGGRPGYEWKIWVATKVLAEELTAAAAGIRLRAKRRDSIHGLTYFTPYVGKRGSFFEPPYALDSAWHCPDLLSAIYLQFYLLVTGRKPTRRCENPACLMPFPVTRKDKRHCNATCRSNARHYPKP